MSETKTNLITYTYKEITVPKSMEGVWKDGLANFGWELTKSEPAIDKAVWGPVRLMIAPLAIFPKSHFAKWVKDTESETNVTLSFRRDRNIVDKDALDRTEFHFETYTNEITRLEKSKTRKPSIVASILGGVGTVFMAVSVFSFLLNAIPLFVVMGVLGLAGWILPAIIFRSMRASQTRKVEPMIEDKYDTLYDVCRKGHALLQA